MLYLVHPDLKTAQDRSSAQAIALGCGRDPADVTKLWWDVQPLTDGSAAIVVIPGTQSDATVSNAFARIPVGLDVKEQGGLQPRAILATLLPDILPSATFLGRFTAKQSTDTDALALSVPAVASKLTEIKGGANVDLQDAAIVGFLKALVDGGVVKSSDLFDIAKPVPVASAAVPALDAGNVGAKPK